MNFPFLVKVKKVVANRLSMEDIFRGLVLPLGNRPSGKYSILQMIF